VQPKRPTQLRLKAVGLRNGEKLVKKFEKQYQKDSVLSKKKNKKKETVKGEFNVTGGPHLNR
jgi:hypothetical protein